MGNALFMTPDRNVAQTYAGSTGTVTEATQTFSNLLDVSTWVAAKQALGLPTSATMEDVVVAARDAGHDGVSFNTTNGKEFVVIKKPTVAEPKAEPKAESKAEPDTAVDDVAFDAYAGDGRTHTGKHLNETKAALAKGELPKNVTSKVKAAYDKLSPEQQAQVRAQIEKYIDNASPDVDFLDNKDATAISAPLHPAVVSLIRENNLVGALQFIGEMRLGRVSDIARQMAAMSNGVSVKIVDLDTDNPIPLVQALFKKAPAARGVAGVYLTSHKGDKGTILLDKNKGLDIWTLLHEGTHALVNNTLNNPSHPLTKQLTNLFEQVKPSLGSAYGATNVQEFVAEARSNPEFQRMLGMIDVGADVSAMAKFVHSVKNFMRGLLGMPQKPMTSALDAVDKLIDSIIAGRDGVARTEGDISFLRKPGETYSQMSQRVLDNIGERTKKLPGVTPERIGAIHEMFFTKIGGGAKEIIRQFLPLHSLCEVATKEIPMAMRLERLIGAKTNDENGRNQEIEQTVKMVNTWASKHPKLIAVLNRVIYKSTEVEVDPSDPRSRYEKFWMSYEAKGGPQHKSFDRRDARDAEVKRLNAEATAKHKAAGGEGKLTVARATGDKNPDKLAAWDKMQADWKELGTEGQATYNRMRDSYKAINEQLRDALEARIDASVTDPNVRTRLKNELYEKLFASGVIRPYFPLLRRGDHWLVYEVNGIQNAEAFESTYERTLAVERLAKDTAVTNVQEMPKPTSTNYKTAPAPAFVRDVLQSLSANKVDSKVSEEIMRLFLDSLPESSFAHSLRSRKGTPGFTVDALDAFRTKPYSIARQISNMKYSAKFEALRSEMRDYVKTKNNTQVATDYYNEMSERIDFAINPNVPEWSKVARSAIYGYTLGLNVSSALIGLVQVPQLVAPFLAGTHGVVNTTRAIGRAMKYFTNSGTSHTVSTLIKGEKVTVPAGPSLDNYDFTSKDAPKHLETLVKVARERGQMSRSQTYDMLGQSDGASILTKVNAVSGFMQHHTERMARQVTLAAAYELKLQDLVGKGKKLSSATIAQQQQAAEYAVDVSELTVGGTSAAAAPRIAQGAIGSVVMMYKRYGIQMYYTLFRTAKQAFFTDKPKGMSDVEFKQFKGAAQRQMAGIYAMTLLLAGVQGIPMFGMVAMLYNMLVPEEDEDDFDTAARKFLKEGMYSGALNALTGSEVAARISLSDLIFRDSMTPVSENPMMSFVEFVGGPAVGVTNRVIRGVQNINEGEIQRGVEQILPSAVGNAMKSVRYATEGITTARGDPIVEDVGPMTLGAQFFGFAPAEYTRQLEINSELKTFDRDTLERKTKLLRKYYVAMSMGDADGVSEITDELLRFNDRYPEIAITPSTIKKSMEQHRKTTQEMHHGVTISKPMRDRVRSMAEEYEDSEE